MPDLKRQQKVVSSVLVTKATQAASAILSPDKFTWLCLWFCFFLKCHLSADISGWNKGASEMSSGYMKLLRELGSTWFEVYEVAEGAV